MTLLLAPKLFERERQGHEMDRQVTKRRQPSQTQ